MLNKFWSTIRRFIAKRINALWAGTNLLINLAIWLIIIFRIPQTADSIPLHYNSAFGIDWLGEWRLVFLYPILGLIIFLLNLGLGIWLQDKNKSFSLIMIITSAFEQLTILLAMVFLVINFY